MPRPNSVTLRFLAEPSQVNFGGKVHGGAVMKWLDQAGYACAAGWTGQYCVTAWVGAIRFLRPIAVGELVEVGARLIHTGRTSMQIAVDVYAGPPTSAEHHRAGHCVMTFVAVDPAGRPAPVPPWQPETPVDLALDEYARRLMEMRASLDREIEERLRWLDQQRPAVTGRG
ncbi:MAG TPA: acyl-CoA thioesterase [Gemmatimonadales bacterium]|nr:acyl-CoA thioesterase [Gemmatimonadales bacterium]